jgi:hypothetical protein
LPLLVVEAYSSLDVNYALIYVVAVNEVVYCQDVVIRVIQTTWSLHLVVDH